MQFFLNRLAQSTIDHRQSNCVVCGNIIFVKSCNLHQTILHYSQKANKLLYLID